MPMAVQIKTHQRTPENEEEDKEGDMFVDKVKYLGGKRHLSIFELDVSILLLCFSWILNWLTDVEFTYWSIVRILFEIHSMLLKS